MSKDALDSLYETLFWLSQADAREDVAEARRALGSEETLIAADARTRYRLPPQ